MIYKYNYIYKFISIIMSVYLQLLSGEILTFSIFEGYKFSNLRSEFYELMSEELSISELECIVIFDNNDIVDINDYITEGKTYNVFVNKLIVRLVFDENFHRVNFEHDYQHFPYNTSIQITRSVQDNYSESYNYMYNNLSESFEEDIDFFDDDPDNFWSESPLQTFREYINNKYRDDNNEDNNYDLTLEEMIIEYINRYLSKHINVKEFLY